MFQWILLKEKQINVGYQAHSQAPKHLTYAYKMHYVLGAFRNDSHNEYNISHTKIVYKPIKHLICLIY